MKLPKQYQGRHATEGICTMGLCVRLSTQTPFVCLQNERSNFTLNHPYPKDLQLWYALIFAEALYFKMSNYAKNLDKPVVRCNVVT